MLHVHLQRCLATSLIRFDMYVNVIEKRWRILAMLAHHGLDKAIECRGGILEALWHHEPLPEHSARGADCRQGNIRFPHKDLIKSIHQIDSREDFASLHAID